MGIVELGLGILKERLDPPVHWLGQAPARSPAPVAMDQRLRAATFERPTADGPAAR